MSRDGEDGGEELPDPSPGWYAIHQPQQDPAKVISGPHNRPEKAASVASIPSGNSAVMHTPALVNAVKNEGYNVVWQKGAEKPSALEEPEPVTDGGRPMASDDDGESYPVKLESDRGAGSFDSGAVRLDLPDEGEYMISIYPSEQMRDVAVAATFENDEVETWVCARVDPDEARRFAEALLNAAKHVDGSPDGGGFVEIDAEAAAVAFDALQLLLEFDAHSPPLHPLADIGREPVEEASRTLGEVLAAPGGEDA